MRDRGNFRGCLLTVFLCASAAMVAQQPESAPQPNLFDGTANALTVSPACPAVGNDSTTHKFKSEQITVRYDPASTTALFRSPTSLTLHVAPVGLGRIAPLKDIPMVPQSDGTWLGSFDLIGAEAGTGYVMLEVENSTHEVDQNHGDFWDFQLCRSGKPQGAQMKAHSYEGQLLAPGMKRTPDPVRALSIVREDLSANPQNYGDLFWMWNLETQNGTGSPAEWAQVNRQIDLALERNATQPMGQNALFLQTIGFVAPYELKLDPSVIERYRSAIANLPRTEQAAHYGQDGELHAIPRTSQWDQSLSRMVTSLLSELDFGQIEGAANPSAEAYERFANKYSNCNECRNVAEAFALALRDYAEKADYEAAQRSESAWAAWDPKNPDPPATLAEAYLQANTRLPEALQLVNRAAQLYVPCSDITQCQPRYHEIRSQMYYVVSPGPDSRGRLEFLRGRIEAACADWPAAFRDFERAMAAMPHNEDIQAKFREASTHVESPEPH